MRKNKYLVRALSAMLSATLVAQYPVHMVAANSAKTIINETIEESMEEASKDLVWDNTTEPYELTENLQIGSGSTMTIAPGVEVHGNGYAIEVYGKLNAEGVTFENTKINAKNEAYNPSTITLKNCKLEEGGLSGKMSVTLVLENNSFHNMKEEIELAYPATETMITGNVFNNCGGLKIKSRHNTYIKNNTFYKMTTGYAIKSVLQSGTSNCYVEKNSFLDEGTVLVIDAEGKMDAKNNFWNTTEEEEIAKRIQAASEEAVSYLPFLSEAASDTPVLKHNYDNEEIVKEPTCEEVGLKVVTCSDCKDEKEVEIPALGHKFSKKWSIDKKPGCEEAGEKSHHCEREGCEGREDITEIEPTDHSFSEEWTVDKAPTCDEKGMESHHCENEGCTVTEGSREIEALGHEFSEEWTVDEKPTCDKEGTQSRHCKHEECTETIDRQEIPPVGHSFSGEWIVKKEATCQEEGEKIRACEHEGCKETETEVIPKTDHKWDEGKVTVEPTCEKEGSKTYTCEVSGTTKTETIAPLGHSFSKEWTVDKKATCKTEGEKSHHCTHKGCTERTNITVIPKTDHKWDAGKITKQPTCKEEGIKTYTCKECGTKKTEKVAKTAHKYTKKVVSPTTKKKGYTEYTCSVCKHSYRSNYTSFVSVKGITLNKKTVTLAKGQKVQLTATVKPTNATTKKVTYTSSNKKVAVVDANGKVTAIKNGTATITAKTVSGQKVATCRVTVTSGSLVEKKVTIGKGATKSLTVKGPYNKIVWSTSNRKVATVTNKGAVKAVGTGTAKITATIDGKKYSCTVTVKKNEKVVNGSTNVYSVKKGVQLTDRKFYYEGSSFVYEANILNRTNKAVKKIKNPKVSIYADGKLIASNTFGTQPVKIKAMGSSKVRFKFKALKKDVDLVNSKITVKYSMKYE